MLSASVLAAVLAALAAVSVSSQSCDPNTFSIGQGTTSYLDVNASGVFGCNNNNLCGWQGDITAVTAGTGLLGGGLQGDVTLNVDSSYVQRRLATTCPVGQAIRAVSSTGVVTCQAASSAWTVSGSDVVRTSGSVYVNGATSYNGVVSSRATLSGTSAVHGQHTTGPNNIGELGVQSSTDYQGVTGFPAGREIGVFGLSDGVSSTDNFGVYGVSNNVAVAGEHIASGHVGRLGTANAGVEADDAWLNGNLFRPVAYGYVSGSTCFGSACRGATINVDVSGTASTNGIEITIPGYTASSNSVILVTGYDISSTASETCHAYYQSGANFIVKCFRDNATTLAATNFYFLILDSA